MRSPTNTVKHILRGAIFTLAKKIYFRQIQEDPFSQIDEFEMR